LSALGFLLITGLSIKKVPGAILFGVLTITVIGLVTGRVDYEGVFSAPPTIAPIFMELDIVSALELGMVSIVLSILFVNLFDTAGTLLGVATKAGIADEKGNIRNLDLALRADSTSSVAGALIGCAPVTSYVESAAGVSAGGRTGLTACTVGLLFLLATFFSPLAGMVPAFATAGALIYVALLMMDGMQNLPWGDPGQLLPALVTIIMIPLSFSIADGIALGFISYVTFAVVSGKYHEVSGGAWVLTAIFASKFAFS
jgi:AGZA family xanthine/uracil permease-like MFS transporter